jgi:predicted alpha/beta superfamily hydrolase
MSTVSRRITRARLSIVVAAAVMLATLSCARSPTGPSDNTWRFLPGTVEGFSLQAFRDGRQCWIYLPPGYALGTQRYPVLYLNDGEMMFDERDGMHVHRICEDLIRRGEIRPLIVVAITNGPGAQRWIDYSPWPAPYYTPNGGGDSYVRAIRDTLKPAIDRRYRTLADARHTAMGGVSLGGLISAYAGFAYDSTFGMFAAFSPSYWWDAYAIVDFARSRGRPRFLARFYQDTGEIDNSIDDMTAVALEQGYTLGLDFESVTAQGARHTTDTWEYRFPNMLRFLFEP